LPMNILRLSSHGMFIGNSGRNNRRFACHFATSLDSAIDAPRKMAHSIHGEPFSFILHSFIPICERLIRRPITIFSYT
jgi:hypothetical protein